MSRWSAVTSPIFEYFTLARTGYMIAQQTDCNRQRDGIDSDRVERLVQPSEHPAQEKPDGHGDEYPDRQVTVTCRRLAYDPSGIGAGFRRLTRRL